MHDIDNVTHRSAPAPVKIKIIILSIITSNTSLIGAPSSTAGDGMVLGHHADGPEGAQTLGNSAGPVAARHPSRTPESAGEKIMKHETGEEKQKRKKEMKKEMQGKRKKRRKRKEERSEE